ncbi:MAG: phosphoribosylamine--glycine ligase [Spirochaetota bacterium]|nr:phosphoribosylamine--glycine ligase [Spirochaetota bacterium]
MKYLIIGSGGREHALYWRLLSDGSAREVFVAPGNGGIRDEYRIDMPIDDFDRISKFCVEQRIDAVIVGPEAPLCSGIVDYLEGKRIPVIGPSKRAAMLEGSKLFAKSIMEKYAIPTAKHIDFIGRDGIIKYIEGYENYPMVIKLDGLAAGKGVGIPESRKEAIDFVNQNVRDDTRVFIEDFIDGEEVSVLGISDGETVLPFVAAQDHKRIFDEDRGPNTGGMGAYAPAPLINDKKLQRICTEILKPTIAGMREEGIAFKGILYAGLIVCDDEIRVLEFNVRFGDPEVQAILPLLDGKLGDVFQKTISGNLKDLKLFFLDKFAITVVLASGGYPGDYKKGKEIKGLESLSDDIILFHAGTRTEGGSLYTNGGRVLNVTAISDDYISARDKVYNEIEKISFEGMYYRPDIGNRVKKYL